MLEYPRINLPNDTITKYKNVVENLKVSNSQGPWIKISQVILSEENYETCVIHVSNDTQ